MEEKTYAYWHGDAGYLMCCSDGRVADFVEGCTHNGGGWIEADDLLELMRVESGRHQGCANFVDDIRALRVAREHLYPTYFETNRPTEEVMELYTDLGSVDAMVPCCIHAPNPQ